MLEKCSHCGANVLYVTDFCPNCQKSKTDGRLAEGFSATPSVAKPTRIKVLIVVTLMSIAAVVALWYAQYVKSHPMITVVGHKIGRLPLDKYVEFLAILTTPDTNGMAHISLRPEYEKAKADLERKKAVSTSLVVVGIALLGGAGAMASRAFLCRAKWAKTR